MTEPNEEPTILPALMNFRDTAPHAFVPPAVTSVAAAARARHRRRVGLVTAATVTLVGAASAIAVAQLPQQTTPLADPTPSPSSVQESPSPSPSPSPIPSPSPSGSPEPTAGPEVVPLSKLLTPEDLGPGHTIFDGVDSGDWPLGFFTMLCDKVKHESYPGPRPPKVGYRERTIIGPKPVTLGVSLGTVESQAWEMNYTRRWVADCAGFTADKPYTMQVVASGFAGDDSLLVKVNDWYWAHVRKGEWMTQIAFGESRTLAEMKDVAVKAAARL